MSRFRVGDVVEIVDHPLFVNKHCRKYIGHVGALLEHMGDGYWLVDGATEAVNRRTCEHHECTLRLRRPPSWDQWITDTRDVERECKEGQPA